MLDSSASLGKIRHWGAKHTLSRKNSVIFPGQLNKPLRAAAKYPTGVAQCVVPGVVSLWTSVHETKESVPTDSLVSSEGRTEHPGW